MRLDDVGIERDDDGHVIGYLVGRDADIAEWKLKKEFANKDISSLRAIRNNQRWRSRNPELMKARSKADYLKRKEKNESLSPEEKRQKWKERYKKDKEKHLLRNVKWRARNQEKVRELGKKNHEKRKLQLAARTEEEKAAHNLKRRMYRAANAERIREKERENYERNKRKEEKQTGKKRRAHAKKGELTKEQRKKLIGHCRWKNCENEWLNKPGHTKLYCCRDHKQRARQQRKENATKATQSQGQVEESNGPDGQPAQPQEQATAPPPGTGPGIHGDDQG